MVTESKKVVLKYESDVSSLIRGLSSVDKASARMAKTLGKHAQKVAKDLGGAGSSVKKTADVYDKTGKKLKSMGKEVSTVSRNYKLLNGVTGRYTETVTRMSDGTKKVTGAFKQANTATGGFVSKLGVLAKRAIGVVLVWSTLRAGMQSLNRLFKSSIKFLIEWEFQMAQVAIVGGTTANQIKILSGALIQVGKDFGISFKDLGEAAKLWRQQGRSMEEIIPLMRTTAKLSLLTGQTTVESVENLTAVLKAYKIEAKDSINIIDSMTNVMLKHAITAGDLSSAYKQVASTASVLGVSFEELTGFITAIKAVTRDSGSKIGLSLRTMFSRITTSSKEAIQNLASVPLHLDSLGRSTFTVTPRMRNLGDIISELSLKFGSLGNAQKSQLATLIGGVRRQNQVFALFDNFTESVEAQTDAIFGLGKASNAIDILTDTAKIGIEKLKNAWFSFIESVASSSVIKNVINGLTTAVNALDQALAPRKAQFKESLTILNKQNDEFSRQAKFADGVFQVIKQIEQLQEQSTRASKEQNKIIDEQANTYRKALNEASKLAGLDFEVDESAGLSGLLGNLESVESKLNSLKLDAVVGQQLVKIKTEVLSTGREISLLIDQFRKFSQRTAGDRFEFTASFDKSTKEGRELFRVVANLGTLIRKGEIIPEKAIARFKKLAKEFGDFSKEEQDFLFESLDLYQQKNEKLANTNAIREEEKKKMEIIKKTEEDLVLNQKKRQIISKAIIADQLERLKLSGALNSEVLELEKLLKKELDVEDKLTDRLITQLALEREKTKEQRLQGRLGSDSVKLFDIAKAEGTRVAKAIGKVLSGETDFAEFVRRGGKELEVFKKEFASIFKQQQALQFFKGERVSGEKELRGGADISIAEPGIRQTAKQQLAEAKKREAELFRQEQLVITPQKVREKAIKFDPVAEAKAQQPIATVVDRQAVPLTVETNITLEAGAGITSEAQNALLERIKQDQQALGKKWQQEYSKLVIEPGTGPNKAVVKANFGKQANNN